MLAVCLVFWEKRERECMWLKISDLKQCLCMLQAVFICFGKRERMYVIEDQWFKAVPMYVTSCFYMFWEKESVCDWRSVICYKLFSYVLGKERESVCDWRSVIQSSAYVCYKLFSYVLGRERESVCMWLKISDLKSSAYVCYKLFSYVLGKERKSVCDWW